MHTTITFDHGVSFGVVDNRDGGVILLLTDADTDTMSTGIKLTAAQAAQFATDLPSVAAFFGFTLTPAAGGAR